MQMPKEVSASVAGFPEELVTYIKGALNVLASSIVQDRGVTSKEANAVVAEWLLGCARANGAKFVTFADLEDIESAAKRTGANGLEIIESLKQMSEEDQTN